MTELTDSEKAAIADSAKAVLRALNLGAERLSAAAFLARFSSDADMRLADAGALYTLKEFEQVADQTYSGFESITIVVDSMTAIVLGPEAAAVTEAFHADCTTKDGSAVTFVGVISVVVQLRDGRWQILQYHESQQAPAEADAAVDAPGAAPS
jgi:hypothetical protein